MKRRRVKITGIGPVTPAGIGKDAFWKGILEPVSRVRPYKKLGDEYGPLVAAYMGGFDIGDYVDRTLVPKGAARHTLFAIAGSVLALQDAEISKAELGQGNCAIVVGSSLLDFGGIGSAIESAQKNGLRGVQPRVVFSSHIANVPDAVNQVLGITAHAMTVQSSCCSGMDAMGYAADLVATGNADIVLCGGTEAPLYRFPLLEFRAAGLTPSTGEMAERLARPFDLWRTTGVVSEGACMFVIEPETSPRPGYSFISGYGYANDERGDLCGGMAVAARLAIAQARIRPAQIDAIHAWGPGHKLIDEAETRAMASVFQSALSELPAVSIKGAIGSALGAAPAIQAASAALALRFGILPPTVNWTTRDPACDLNLSNQSRLIVHERALLNAHGVANVNSALILERC